MTGDPRPLPADSTDQFRQWAVNLVPPLAALLDLQVTYSLVDHACRTGDTLTGHLVHAGFLLLTLVMGGVAWLSWSDAGAIAATAGGDPAARSRFMALVGLMISALSALTVAAQWLPTFFLHPCQ